MPRWQLGSENDLLNGMFLGMNGYRAAYFLSSITGVHNVKQIRKDTLKGP
jgi:hypothetical protein